MGILNLEIDPNDQVFQMLGTGDLCKMEGRH